MQQQIDREKQSNSTLESHLNDLKSSSTTCMATMSQVPEGEEEDENEEKDEEEDEKVKEALYAAVHENG